MRHVSDYSTYRKLHSTLPAAVLSALKARVRAGEPKTIKEIWDRRDKTFLALDFKWNERNEKSVLEWGYAAVRCGHLEALGHWPPNPDGNYRKGHYIVAEYVDKVTNKYLLNYPWQFGDSQVAPKAKLPQIIQAVISSMSSPDSETTPNHLVLVGHNIHGNLARLDDMKFKLPHNMLVIDTMVYERSLYASGHRGTMPDPSPSSKADGGSKIRVSGSQLSFDSLLWSLTIPFGSAPSPLGPGSNSDSTDSNSSASPAPGGKHPISETIHPPQLQHHQHHQHHQHQHPVVLPQCTVHNAGNTAVLCLFALQKLLEPAGTAVPSIKRGRLSSSGFAGQNVNAMAAAARMSGMMGMGMGVPVPMMMNGMPMINAMPVNNSRMSMMIPKANDSATSAATPMINVNGSSAALPLPFPSSPGMQHPPRPSVRPSSYDLAAEFGAMSSDRRNGNRSGGENAETNRPSSAYLTAPGRGEKASKRFHSFSGGLTLGGSTSHPKVEK
ncbi:hypothetical protein NLJ89_g530 [Agrocybe chaxingu]|uniref:Gfd2/YDR514C-like C-terminal domain-containing protein n=1 Tax=Agrocybe chaxingu TaxID=84603 RepID=A0A9W8N1S4_9AGAR|nr:hypothetical protein NLJ89_g530 [Agrocybe chaxingu]